MTTPYSSGIDSTTSVGKHYEGDFEDEGLIRWALEHRLVMERDPNKSSSDTSESVYEPFNELSPSAREVLMENHCNLQSRINSYLGMFVLECDNLM